MAEAPEPVNIPLVWEETEERPILFANQFLVQHQPDEFVVTFGQVLAPPLLGTEDERREQLSKLSYVPVRILGRYGFTRRRMQELIKVLEENLAKHDETLRQMTGGEE
jgi:hypothetical protein